MYFLQDMFKYFTKYRQTAEMGFYDLQEGFREKEQVFKESVNYFFSLKSNWFCSILGVLGLHKLHM